MVNPRCVIKKFTTSGVLVDSIADLCDEGWGLTYGDGHLWVADPWNWMIYKINPTLTGIADSLVRHELPLTFTVHAPYPNPFRRRASISYELRKSTHVTVTVYDSGGRLVKTLVEGLREAGLHEVWWAGDDGDGREVTGGVYFCRIVARQEGEAAHYGVSRKLILLR
jgi:hypothetical protein